MSKKIARRQFLTYIAADVGATTLNCVGMGAIASRRPVDVQFRKLGTNRNPMNSIVLLTYATRAGSTMEIARTIALDPIRNQFRLMHEAYFTGVYDPTKVSAIERLMGEMVKTPVGDFRDWDAIKKWGHRFLLIEGKW